jgi:cellulose synthase/poly-beta-1,6-N-acetylglucosamine synthase-like glycosyltransferase
MRRTSAALSAFQGIASLPLLYLGGLTVAAVVSETDRTSKLIGRSRTPSTNFAILIPAHNEGFLLRDTLRSACEQRYPSALFQIHVVADNCDDNTAVVAREFAVTVHERSDPSERGKGPALNWLIDRVLNEGSNVTACVFVDADTVMEDDFLEMMDRGFADGADAIQGNYGVRDAFSSVPSSLRFCALTSRHHARPLGRCAVGGSCGLFGNGMAFSASLLRTRRWSAHLVEDMEFQLGLLHDGYLVRYLPEARVHAEMPRTFNDSVSQHERWERGRLNIARQLVPRLLRQCISGGPAGRVAMLDASADALVPPMSILGAAVVASLVSSAVVHMFAPSRASRWNLARAMGLVALLCGHVLASLRLSHAPRAAYLALLRAPQLVAWKLLVLTKVVSGPADGSWVRTRRNEST